MPRRKNIDLLKEEKTQRVAMKKGINAKCLDCMCGQKSNCLIEDCPIYQFNPFRNLKS